MTTRLFIVCTVLLMARLAMIWFFVALIIKTYKRAANLELAGQIASYFLAAMFTGQMVCMTVRLYEDREMCVPFFV